MNKGKLQFYGFTKIPKIEKYFGKILTSFSK